MQYKGNGVYMFGEIREYIDTFFTTLIEAEMLYAALCDMRDARLAEGSDYVHYQSTSTNISFSGTILSCRNPGVSGFTHFYLYCRGWTAGRLFNSLVLNSPVENRKLTGYTPWNTDYRWSIRNISDEELFQQSTVHNDLTICWNYIEAIFTANTPNAYCSMYVRPKADSTNSTLAEELEKLKLVLLDIKQVKFTGCNDL